MGAPTDWEYTVLNITIISKSFFIENGSNWNAHMVRLWVWECKGPIFRECVHYLRDVEFSRLSGFNFHRRRILAKKMIFRDLFSWILHLAPIQRPKEIDGWRDSPHVRVTRSWSIFVKNLVIIFWSDKSGRKWAS